MIPILRWVFLSVLFLFVQSFKENKSIHVGDVTKRFNVIFHNISYKDLDVFLKKQKTQR